MDNRKIEVDASYLELFGRTVYNSLYLEWQVLYLAEQLKPGFTTWQENVSPDERIKALRTIVAESSIPNTVKERLNALFKEYYSLTIKKTLLVHSNPIIGEGKTQKMYFKDPAGFHEWTAENLKLLSLNFERAAMTAADIFQKDFASTSIAHSEDSLN